MTKDQHIKPTIETIKEFKAHYAKRDFRIEEMRMEKNLNWTEANSSYYRLGSTKYPMAIMSNI